MSESNRPSRPRLLMRAFRPALAYASLVLLAARQLQAQDARSATAGRRVIVDVCAAPGEALAGGVRTVTLLDLDADGLLLEHEGRIPMSRVRRMEVSVVRSRELEPLGVIVGAVAGVLTLARLVGRSDTAGGEVVALPVFVLGGGFLGYLAGARLSGTETWAPLTLPPGHGSSCP